VAERGRPNALEDKNEVTLTAAAMVALVSAGAAYAQTANRHATSPGVTTPGVTTPGVVTPQDSRAGTGTPSMPNPTANTTTGTATGDNPPGSSGQITPGMQNSGSTTSQAGGDGGGAGADDAGGGGR